MDAAKESASAAAKVGTDEDKKRAEEGIRDAEAALSAAEDDSTSAELVLKRETAEAAAAAAAVEAVQETAAVQDLAREALVSERTMTEDFDEMTTTVGPMEDAQSPKSPKLTGIFPAVMAVPSSKPAAAQSVAAEEAAHEAQVAEKKKAEVSGSRPPDFVCMRITASTC